MQLQCSIDSVQPQVFKQFATTYVIISGMNDNIIHTFQQRRHLEQDLAAFAQTKSETELVAAAQRIVHTYPADLVLTLLTKHLETPDSQTRGGLGHLAARLPPEATLIALRAVVANRQNTPQARFTAAVIAERFLDVELPAALMSDLNNTDEVAFQSLREALDESKRDRHVLLEYVTQMQAMGEAIAFMVLGLLERIPPVDRIDLLRLIAQDSRPHVAEAALDRLERLANSEASDLALRALHTLQFTLPTALSTHAERTLRKLRFTGKRYHAPAASQWRALLSPAEPSGYQTVWLIQQPTPDSTVGAFFGFVFSIDKGIQHFFGSDRVEQSMLPAVQTVGSLVSVATDGGGTAVLLEAPFDYGRWLILRALAIQRAGNGEPLEGEYTLYNDLFWQFDPPHLDDQVAQFFHKPGASSAPALDPMALDAATETLLAHPAMEGWQLQNRTVQQAMRFSQGPDRTLPVAEMVAFTLREMEKWPERTTLLTALEAGLRMQAGWLFYAGELETAQSAQHLADQMGTLPLTQNPLLARMLAAGIA